MTHSDLHPLKVRRAGVKEVYAMTRDVLADGRSSRPKSLSYSELITGGITLALKNLIVGLRMGWNGPRGLYRP